MGFARRKVSKRTDPRNPTVAIVVLNWNAKEQTEQCVTSLEEDPYLAKDIVIVDNGSTDGSREHFKRKFQKHTVIARRSNDGYSTGNNEGIRYAIAHGADNILLINNDVIVTSGFLQPMVDILRTKPRVGIVTCKAFFDVTRQRIYCTAGRMSYVRCSGVSRQSILEDTEGLASFVSGCILLVRREVFETVGLLDESYFMYYEDLEFSLRVQRVFDIAYTPHGVVFHKSGGGQHWSNATRTYLYYTSRNRFWVFRDEPRSYRLYVTVYSVILALIKSFVITGSAGNAKRARVVALWLGVWDGMHGNMTRRIEPDA